MNIILTRTKDEYLNVWWEPFATSTPLKPRSNNAEIVSVPEKQLLIHGNSPDYIDKLQRSCRTTNALHKESAESKPLVCKKTKKKKSSTYFDLTSSSDEDSSDGNKKRPIIKLRSGKKTKSILVNKNMSNEKISTNKEINNGKKLENMCIKDCETNAVLNVDDFKFENIQSRNSKSRTLNGTLKLSSNFKDTALSSDEDSKIFDETRKAKNTTKDITLHLVNKENAMSNSKSDSLKHLNGSDNRGKKVLKETSIISPVFKKSVLKNNSYDSESQSRTSDYNKSCKSQKRKYKNNKNSINIVKRTKTEKGSDKLVAHFADKPLKNSGSLLHIWECKTNLSHQLFSDSREQELINVLDLTSEEVDEKLKNMESASIKKKKKLSYKSCNSSHPSVNKSLNLNECEQNQPKRKKQNWKCLMPENTSNELLQNVNAKIKIKSKKTSKTKFTSNGQIPEFQIQQKSEELGVFSEGVNEENCTKNGKKNLKASKKPIKRTANAPEKSKTSHTINNLTNKSIGDFKLKNTEVSNMLTSAESNMDSNKTINSNKPLVPEENKKAVNRKKTVFKLLKELSYKESEMGCSVAQGWSINNFKCGVFKLKVRSQMSCKTVHSNSNLGGVLIKGNLRMKVGNRELNLTEGDMVFVPPLTEWLATNIDEKVINNRTTLWHVTIRHLSCLPASSL